jgi:hypothetical protein
MESGGNMGPMGVLVSIVIGLVVLIALYSFVPVIGANIENSMPDVASTSDWNPANNEKLPSAVDLWESNAGLISLAILALLISIAVAFFKSIGSA